MEMRIFPSGEVSSCFSCPKLLLVQMENASNAKKNLIMLLNLNVMFTNEVIKVIGYLAAASKAYISTIAACVNNHLLSS